MSEKTLDEIQNAPAYLQLLAERRKIIWPLAIVMIVVYFSYILFIAFAPSYLAIPLGQTVLTTGLIAALGVILSTFVITAVYVYLANKKLEPLTRKVEEELRGSL